MKDDRTYLRRGELTASVGEDLIRIRRRGCRGGLTFTRPHEIDDLETLCRMLKSMFVYGGGGG